MLFADLYITTTAAQELGNVALKVFDIHNFGKARRPIAFAFIAVVKRVSLPHHRSIRGPWLDVFFCTIVLLLYYIFTRGEPYMLFTF